jgi:hypothetical protein
MVKTLKEKIRKIITPDEHDIKYLINRDIDRVGFAATLLQMSEFRFFKMSYFRWYGRHISDRSLEYIFDDFMFERSVPHYVRYFSREVIDLFEKGRLDPKDFGINHPRPTPETRSAGIGYIVMLLLVLIVFLFLITGHISY